MLTVFDSHFHIIDSKFPLVSNHSYLPPLFTTKDYLMKTKHLNIVGGAIVSGSFQAFDQTYLLAALRKLGPSFVGVTQLPDSVPDKELIRYHTAGVRAIRFNFKRGGSEGVKNLESFAKRVHEVVGWHVELYVDSNDLFDLSPTLLRLLAVSIDHLGLSQKGLPELLVLVEKGVKVKATGFGRVDFDVASALKKIASINPDALMFGTDLPSTRAPRPFSDGDIQIVRDIFDDDLLNKIFYLNAVSFYKPKESLFSPGLSSSKNLDQP
ncbi:amidohydrolase family protein [Simkania negevensis]|uniref:Amidohydrolase family protein n=1 Tax=Simkania negevensis TaxID=83561 RepID=A0ABS3AR57_9BACT|nr:amidohydrolase family protein [Simkania negevensis]